MKKLIALVTFFTGGSLLLFLLTLLGCGKRDFSILYKDIFTKVIRYQSNGFETPVAENDTCTVSNCYLETTFDVTQLSSRYLALPGNNAWAFQPGPRSYKPIEKIKNLRIVSLQRFNVNYPAGTDMTASCRFLFGGTYNEQTDSSAASAIAGMNEGYGDEVSSLAPVLHIYFAEKPEALSGQQFAIEFKMETEALIRDTTIFFYLKP